MAKAVCSLGYNLFLALKKLVGIGINRFKGYFLTSSLVNGIVICHVYRRIFGEDGVKGKIHRIADGGKKVESFKCNFKGTAIKFSGFCFAVLGGGECEGGAYRQVIAAFVFVKLITVVFGNLDGGENLFFALVVYRKGTFVSSRRKGENRARHKQREDNKHDNGGSDKAQETFCIVVDTKHKIKFLSKERRKISR